MLSAFLWAALTVAFAALLWTPFGQWLERQLESSRAGLARFSRVGASSLLGLLVIFGLAMQLQIGQQNLSPDPSHFRHHASVEASQWITSHTSPSDIIMASQVPIVHRLTGRRSVNFPATSHTETIFDVIQRNRVKYLVVWLSEGKYPYYLPTEEERFDQLTASYPAVFSVIDRGSGYLILKVIES